MSHWMCDDKSPVQPLRDLRPMCDGRLLEAKGDHSRVSQKGSNYFLRIDPNISPFKPFAVTSALGVNHECRRYLHTFWIIGSCVSCLISILVTGIIRIQSVSVRWQSSSTLMAAMTVSSSESGCLLISRDEASARPNSVVLRYCMLKSYPSRMIAHRCNRLAEYTRIPFFEPNIERSGLWSVRSVKWRPNSILWNFFTAKISARASFSTWLQLRSAGVRDLAAVHVCEITAPTPYDLMRPLPQLFSYLDQSVWAVGLFWWVIWFCQMIFGSLWARTILCPLSTVCWVVLWFGGVTARNFRGNSQVPEMRVNC